MSFRKFERVTKKKPLKKQASFKKQNVAQILADAQKIQNTLLESSKKYDSFKVWLKFQSIKKLTDD